MNLCRSCTEDFGGVQAFDAHRIGKHAYCFSPEHPDGRRCLTTSELRARGFWRNSRGRWSLRTSRTIIGSRKTGNQPQSEGGSALKEAERLLAAELAGGPKLTREILQIADEAGVSRQTLKRAKARLRVTSEKIAFSRGRALPATRTDGATHE